MRSKDDPAETSTTSHTALLWPILLCSLPLYILSFLLPIYAQRLGASAADIGGLFFLFAMVIVLIRPLVGVAMDRFGRKRFFLLGLLCYVVAMGVFATATDIAALYLARLLQGIGAALTWIASYTIAAELAVTGRRGESLGQVDGASDRGAFCGAVLALAPLSWLSLRFGWQVLFLGYAVCAGIGVWLAWRRVPETRPPQLYPLPWAPARPWSAVRLLSMIVGNESSTAPMSRSLWRLLGVAFVTKASWALIGPLLLIFLQNKFTPDLWKLALAYVPATLILGFLPARMGRLSDRMGRMPLIALGLGWSGVVSFFLPGLPTLGWFMVFFALNAFGIVMTMPAQKALVGDLTRREDWGKAFGMYTFAGSLGSAVGPLLGGWLYDTFAPTTPFYVNGVLLLCNAVSVLLLFGRHVSRTLVVSGRASQEPPDTMQSNQAAAESSLGETSNP
jgi:MFS family permease